MTRMNHHTRPRTALMVAVLLAAALLLTAVTALAQAVRFESPPGLDAGKQERLLQERVTKLADELLGGKVLEVMAQVRYLRTATPQPAGQAEPVKLPGFNQYLKPQQGEVQIVSEYTRLRQVFVLVAKDVEQSLPELENELRSGIGFDERKGDLLRVMQVDRLSDEAARSEMNKAVAEAKDEVAAQLRKEASRRDARSEMEAEAKAAMGGTPARTARAPEDALTEPQSTVYLIKAREAFFARDYNRALDQILQSIQLNPNNPQAYAMLGSLYYAMNWRSLALKYWERALRMDPENREIEDLIAQLRSRGT